MDKIDDFIFTIAIPRFIYSSQGKIEINFFCPSLNPGPYVYYALFILTELIINHCSI